MFCRLKLTALLLAPLALPLSATAAQPYKPGGAANTHKFTKLDSSGHALPRTASSWPCVRDDSSGQVWAVKTDTGLRAKSWTYTWGASAADTRSCGDTLGGKVCNTRNFVRAVNQVGLCGRHDWRLPTRHELMSIFAPGRAGPTIDTTFFPNTANDYYWSADSYPFGPAGAWGVYFTDSTYAGSRSNTFHVRLVRGGG